MTPPTWIKEALSDELAPDEAIVDTEELREDKLAVVATQERGYLLQKRFLRGTNVWPFNLDVPAQSTNGASTPSPEPEPEPEPEPTPEVEAEPDEDIEHEAPTKVTTSTGTPRTNGHQLSRLYGIGPERAQNLQAEGIRTVQDLRDEDADTIANAAHVGPETVQAWKNQADLTTIHGIGPTRAKRLEAQGILTLTDLADADTQALASELDVSTSTLEAWQDDARNHAAPPEEFTRLTGVGDARARAILDHGIDTLDALVNADPDHLAEHLDVGEDTVIGWQKEAITDPTFGSDLLDVKGIGRTRARSLIRMGIRSKGTFVDLNPSKIAEGLGVREDTIAGWQRDARQG